MRHGHPSTRHLWWARRSLAVCRAMLLGLLLPDPCEAPAEAAERRTPGGLRRLRRRGGCGVGRSRAGGHPPDPR
ncbi:MAG TPA: DUF1156 domain-containing protein [Methylomirabilota bacterium]|nr:DUF1156 domain-containing protein [Methylomirabilota bacterium]